MKELTKENLKVRIFETRSLMGIAAAKAVSERISGLLETKEHVNIVFATAPSQNESQKTTKDMKNKAVNMVSLGVVDTIFPAICHWSSRLILVVILLLICTFSLHAQSEKTVLIEMSALEAYSDGFVHDVMRSPLRQGVRLNNHVLFENDATGAGVSFKGPFTQPIHVGVLARKQFHLDDPRAYRAHIVFYITQSNPAGKPAPYYLMVNGTRVPGITPSWHEPGWRWVEVPTSLLRRGLNEVLVGSDAPEGEGYDLQFAREDEYEGGGGKYTYQGNTAMITADQIRPGEVEALDGLKPIQVGATSAKSLDGGKTWIKGKLGPNSDITGEYTIRLSLERFKSSGMLDSPPIDLWAGLEAYPIVRPKCRVGQLELDVAAYLPEGTEVIWQMRMANTHDMLDDTWGAWQTLGSGAAASFELGARDQRYLQWRAILKTENPLRSPIVKQVNIRRRLSYDPIPADTYYVVDTVNPRHHYSSFLNTYENAQHPLLRSLRERLNLDSLLKNAHGDFEKINLVRHLVSGLWYHAAPFPEYPEWNAHEILDRNERLGAGGMCIQFSIVFMQALQSLGYHARHINVFSHETVEVYVDELGAWVHVDPESLFDSYEFNTKTGAPLRALDQHKFFLKEFGFSASNPIDWTYPEPWAWNEKGIERLPQPVNFSTFTAHVNNPNQPPPQHTLTGFIRFIPRTDFLSRPTTRPVNQGMTHWPWNGYINWYDEATPRKLQYELHTDRLADFYPTLNRVEYAATYGDTEGEIDIRMITFTPNFDTFEINIDGQGWQPSSKEFKWQLRPAALNTLEMRTRNSVGKTGKSSRLALFWHYREPYQPRQTGK